MLDATRSADFDALVRWAAGASPAEVAAIAPHVLSVAAHGDTLAQGIADYAARELSQLAIRMRPMMEADGGRRGDHRRPARRRRPTPPKQVLTILAEEPELQPIERPVEAVLGALALAGAVTENGERTRTSRCHPEQREGSC